MKELSFTYRAVNIGLNTENGLFYTSIGGIDANKSLTKVKASIDKWLNSQKEAVKISVILLEEDYGGLRRPVGSPIDVVSVHNDGAYYTDTEYLRHPHKYVIYDEESAPLLEELKSIQDEYLKLLVRSTEIYRSLKKLSDLSQGQ